MSSFRGGMTSSSQHSTRKNNHAPTIPSRLREVKNSEIYPAQRSDSAGGYPNGIPFPPINSLLGYPDSNPYEQRGSDLFECQWAVASGQKTVDEALSAILAQRRVLNALEDNLTFGTFGGGGVQLYPSSSEFAPSLYDRPPASAGESSIYASQLISHMMGTGSRSAQQPPMPPTSMNLPPLVSENNSSIAGECVRGQEEEDPRPDNPLPDDLVDTQFSPEFEAWFANAMLTGGTSYFEPLAQAPSDPARPIPSHEQLDLTTPPAVANDTNAAKTPQTPPPDAPSASNVVWDLSTEAPALTPGESNDEDGVGDYSSFIVPTADMITEADFDYANHPADKKVPRPPHNFSVWMKAWYKVNKGPMVRPAIASKVCSAMWKELTAQEQATWTKKAKVVADKHSRAFPGYKYKPSKPKTEPSGKAPKGIRKASGLRTTSSLPIIPSGQSF
ncbi:hypothetical protein FA13DRAFT_1815227 [Coprinellus micaceus]|uniref:HMG box domain-containing protein n=1 Tax=Coprinellus micaceus TaxID=71717 RepID=A0A4Y7T772_COPMI|nr:hypothetical protein FA13DRAFT_1815227 [Coprinellus micaceus]